MDKYFTKMTPGKNFNGEVFINLFYQMASEISENRINPSHGSFVLFEISSTGAVKYLLSISTVVEPGGVLK